MKRNKVKLIATFIIWVIFLVVTLPWISSLVEKTDEPDVIQKIEKQWVEEYDIYRLPKEASLGYLKV